jgi:hypothetical protein
MPSFPSIAPDEISYDLGDLNISEATTVASGPVRFRHSLRNNGHGLQLVFRNRVESDVDLIRTHWNESDGSHGYFQVPAAIWGDASGTVATDALYRYSAPPEEEQKGVYFDVTVAFRILEGWNLDIPLSGGAAQERLVEVFENIAFTGYSPFNLLAYDADPPDAEKLLLAGGA